MKVYEPDLGPDVLIAKWWMQVVDDGDMGRMLGNGSIPLSEFLLFWREPRMLLYETDDKGISSAFWTESIMQGAFFGMWCRPDMRRTPQFQTALDLALTSMFTSIKVLIAITMQPKMLERYTHMGYRMIGTVPELFAGQETYILSLTGADFETAKEARRHGLRVVRLNGEAR